MDALIDESYLEVAAEQLGFKSVLELKKKPPIKPSLKLEKSLRDLRP